MEANINIFDMHNKLKTMHSNTTATFRTDLEPRQNFVKRKIVELGFLALGRGLQSCSHFEQTLIRELATWPEGYCFEMRVKPTGPSLKMQKTMGVFEFMKGSQSADLVVELKNLEIAFQLITTQSGIPQVYAAHGIAVVGNVAKSMALIRMIDVVEAYLYPEFMSKNILKELPKMGISGYWNKLHLLTIGMLLGK
jgi:hypothetical protein